MPGVPPSLPHSHDLCDCALATDEWGEMRMPWDRPSLPHNPWWQHWAVATGEPHGAAPRAETAAVEARHTESQRAIRRPVHDDAVLRRGSGGR